ncbi:unnamed protein product [Caenorhabditis auriculariae]|uniref:GTP cyclohydrolase 1 feedback regulatory protein n=1 Tax=Caenorhabditis auriculariae TaxID=2777116 RepID=A0A8S1HGV7_9PELO|nr:unnamed protein product [Caenorhabditis auriculariae]
MPYLLISTQIRMECGPTFVGDGQSDIELMERLNAKLSKQLGNEFQEYVTPLPPRMVLNQLETEGWKVIGMAGIGQTCAWTLYREPTTGPCKQADPSSQFLLWCKRRLWSKIAAGGFIVGSTGLYLAQKSVQYKVRSLPHYKESLKIVGDHEKAKDVLGVPIQIGAVDLSDRLHNYVDKQKSRLRIPVTGAIDCGYMDVLATRGDEKDQLALNDGIFTIYDTGRWIEEEKPTNP